MRKIKLLQVGQTLETQGFTVYSAGIDQKLMSLSQADRDNSPITTIFSATWDADLSTSPVSLSGVSINNIQLSEVFSVESLYLQSFSYFFDFNNQMLYIAFFDYRNINVGDEFRLGDTLGFISEAQLVAINGVNYPLNTFLGSVYYEPKLSDVSITNQINDQKHGLFVFEDLSATIDNSDGKYDQIRADITGNKAELLIANLSDSPEEEIETGFPFKLSADIEDFNVERKGIVEDVDYSDPSFPVITAIDERANWTQTIATDKLLVSEFSGLPDKYINKLKPLLIGAVDGAKCIPLRADGAAASFDYYITDTQHGLIQSISAVYFKGELGSGKEDRLLTGGEYSVNLTTGIITVSNVEKGDIWIYGIFTEMTETVEIILYLLNAFEGLAYIDSNFNKTEIEIIRALDYSTHVNIDTSGDKLTKVIEKLCSDIQVDMFQQNSVLTMRAANTIGIVAEEVPTYQIIQNPPGWSTDRTDTIKTITINYSQDYRTKLYDTYFDDTFEAEAVNNDRKAIDEEFTTNLTVEADIIEIYTEYYERFIEVPRTIKIDRTIPFMAGLSDFVSFPVIRQNKIADIETTIFENAVYKITEIDIINNTIDCVFFEERPDRGLIVEWSSVPSTIFEWSDDTARIILEAN